VRRSGCADLSASRDLTADSVMSKSLAGAAVTLLIVFDHGIDAPTATFLHTVPNILGSACLCYAQLQSPESLSAGRIQRRVAKERVKLCGAPLQPLQGGESSVGHGFLLRRCATGALWIGCPRSLLTSRCVRA
jgi:hypothetical protein